MFTTLFRIGKDAEIRQTSADPVCDLSLAYNYGKKVDGKQASQWIKASLWGKRAESLAQYLKKGGSIVATLDDLHIQTREYEGKTYTDLVARVVDIKLISSKQSESAPKAEAKPAAQQQTGGFEDDDIPF